MKQKTASLKRSIKSVDLYNQSLWGGGWWRMERLPITRMREMTSLEIL